MENIKYVCTHYTNQVGVKEKPENQSKLDIF